MPEPIEMRGRRGGQAPRRGSPRLAEAGFRMEREGDAWLVAAAPAELAKGAADAARQLAREGGDARRAARALAACRAAIKDGDGWTTRRPRAHRAAPSSSPSPKPWRC